MPAQSTLVCFAVKEEAKPFQKLIGSRPNVKTLITGMGQRNAERAIRAALALESPALVLTCGFAGGLNSTLKTGDVVFTLKNIPALEAGLHRAGALPAQFHCAGRVAITAAEKRSLHQSTGADAVEMESKTIVDICSEKKIPCATVRVIFDIAKEDLPLDFNALMTPDLRMDFRKLAWTILKSPGKIGALMRLQKQSNAAAEKMAQVLAKIIPL